MSKILRRFYAVSSHPLRFGNMAKIFQKAFHTMKFSLTTLLFLYHCHPDQRSKGHASIERHIQQNIFVFTLGASCVHI
ncbi:MAG: hypothetical protein OXC30_03035 [Alphaproteobacteria bacterium]|nr:hypothetical protein [Alphaproteobacteria bacterium]